MRGKNREGKKAAHCDAALAGGADDDAQRAQRDAMTVKGAAKAPKSGASRTILNSSRAIGRSGPQARTVRAGGWTDAKRAAFFEVLRATSNVAEAARTVGMSVSGVYMLRRRDPAFAEGWMEALEAGYAALEMELLHQCRFGRVRTETSDDGKGGPVRTKTVRDFPTDLGLRLLLVHQKNVQDYRAKQGIAPGSDSVRAEIQAKLALVKERLKGGAAVVGDEGGGEKPSVPFLAGGAGVPLQWGVGGPLASADAPV